MLEQLQHPTLPPQPIMSGILGLPPEERAVLAAEYPFLSPPQLTLQLAGDLQQVKSEERERKVHSIGDFYHRKIYPPLRAITSMVIDATEFPLSDLVLPLALHQEKIFALALGGMTYSLVSMLPHQQQLSEADLIGFIESLLKANVALLTPIMYATGMYLANYMRTPLSERMGLKPEEYDPLQELAYVVERINELANAEPLDERATIRAITVAVDKFTMKVDGYKVKGGKIKFSRWGASLVRRSIGGLFNPLLHEVVMSTRLSPEDWAHEDAHRRGNPKEIDAQVIGIASLIDSEEPYLRYLGYRSWLNVILNDLADYGEPCLPLDSQSSRKYGRDAAEGYLRNVLGLNERTISELRRRGVLLDRIRGVRPHQGRKPIKKLTERSLLDEETMASVIYGTLEGTIRRVKGKGLPTLLTSILIHSLPPEKRRQVLTNGSIALMLRELMLKSLLRQEGIRAAYFQGPLRLLKAYRLKQAATTDHDNAIERANLTNP